MGEDGGKVLKTSKLLLLEIAADPDFVRTQTRNYLQSIVYHSVAKVAKLYEIAFDMVPFDPSDDVSDLDAAIKYRNDCAHRYGIDKDGNGNLKPIA
jgi:hypothetical protein